MGYSSKKLKTEEEEEKKRMLLVTPALMISRVVQYELLFFKAMPPVKSSNRNAEVNMFTNKPFFNSFNTIQPRTHNRHKNQFRNSIARSHKH